MAVTVVLAEGFRGEDVDVVIADQPHRVHEARTSPLTGMAAEVVDDDVAGDGEPIEVKARLAGPDMSTIAWTTCVLPPGEVLVLDLVAGRLIGRAVKGPIGFG